MPQYRDKVALSVSIVALLLAAAALFSALRGGADPMLEQRLHAIEGELALLKERAAEEPQAVPAKELFTAAAMEAQMKKMRREIEELKARGGTPGNAGAAGIAAVEEKQERILRDVNKAFHQTWKGMLDTKLGQNGFNEEQRERIVGDYGRMLEGIEDVQTRWLRGELDWSRTMDEIRMRSIEFYDSVERGYDADTARRVLDIAFPTPEMRRFFFSGSGQ